jgi:hypothetical protein
LAGTNTQAYFAAAPLTAKNRVISSQYHKTFWGIIHALGSNFMEICHSSLNYAQKSKLATEDWQKSGPKCCQVKKMPNILYQKVIWKPKTCTTNLFLIHKMLTSNYMLKMQKNSQM